VPVVLSSNYLEHYGGLSRSVQGFLSVVRLPKHVVLNNYKIETE